MFDLDELLGRAELKDRIDELEDERERLQNRYEAESERRAEATTARQEVEAEVNRLEDRIAQLEGELDRVEADETGLDVRRREQLRGARLETILDRLDSVRTDAEGALTAIIDDPDAVHDGFDGLDGRDEATVLDNSDDSDTRNRRDLQDVLGERTALLEDAAPCISYLDDAGLISVTLDPPVLPTDREPAAEWSDRFALDREWFLPTGRYVLALVRTDLFALGVYEDGDRVDYRGFESDVKGSHSKGGFSQARFERIRDEQIDEHLDRCADALSEVDGDDRLFLVGQRGVVETLAEEAGLDPDATAAVDATGNPKPALEDAHHSFWTTELRVL